MRYLTPPKDDDGHALAARDVFNICIEIVRDPVLREQLQAISADIETASTNYNTNAGAKTLYQEHPHTQIGRVDGKELVRVYTGRMVPKTSKGRPTYDRILSAPVHGRCPFCGIGTVNTLDHFLPKTLFPVFSVTPNNLVPACTWCQGNKLEYYATTAGEQLLHPYFDNIDHDVWLKAVVVTGAPAAFRYSVSPLGNWTPDQKARVAAHLKKLKLGTLFASNAGSRLTEIRGRLVKLHNSGGANAVRAHLQEELISIEEDHMNSWTAAMYRAAVASDWFCSDGFQASDDLSVST